MTAYMAGMLAVLFTIALEAKVPFLPLVFLFAFIQAGLGPLTRRYLAFHKYMVSLGKIQN